MQLYARVADGAVAELWPHDPAAPMPDPQPKPADVFGAALGAEFVACEASVQQGWTYDGKAFAAPAPAVFTSVDLRAYAASARYARETAGITVGTAPIATDRDSQGMITGAWAAAQINPSISVAWKTTSGWVSINAAQIEAIATAVLNHVQACFAAEQQVDAAITAGTVTTTAQVDAAFAAVTA